MKRKILLIAIALMAATAALSFAQSAEPAARSTEPTASAAAYAAATAPWKYFAAALSVGISCIAGGIAVGQIGAAAMGAMSENPELAGKALPYAGLAEGICLWGFLVALFILLI